MEDDFDGVRGGRRGERHVEGVGDTPQGRLNINHGHIGAGMRSAKASTSRPTVLGAGGEMKRRQERFITGAAVTAIKLAKAVISGISANAGPRISSSYCCWICPDCCRLVGSS